MSAFMDWFVKQHGPRNIWKMEDTELHIILSQAAGAQAGTSAIGAKTSQSMEDSPDGK